MVTHPCQQELLMVLRHQYPPTTECRTEASKENELKRRKSTSVAVALLMNNSPKLKHLETDSERNRRHKKRLCQLRKTTSNSLVSQFLQAQTLSQMNDKYKSGEGYHVVPPPYTGNSMPPKPDLVLADKDEAGGSELLLPSKNDSSSLEVNHQRYLKRC
ncbi:hypothetical protein Tco_0427534 [Tanacetum coccineum]